MRGGLSARSRRRRASRARAGLVKHESQWVAPRGRSLLCPVPATPEAAAATQQSSKRHNRSGSLLCVAHVVGCCCPPCAKGPAITSSLRGGSVTELSVTRTPEARVLSSFAWTLRETRLSRRKSFVSAGREKPCSASRVLSPAERDC